MCSFLFGVIFLGAAAVGILTGVVVSVCEDVPTPHRELAANGKYTSYNGSIVYNGK
jgi:hypothetical protein